MRSFYMHFRLPSTVAQRQLLRTGDFTNNGTVWVTAMFRQQGVSGRGQATGWCKGNAVVEELCDVKLLLFSLPESPALALSSRNAFARRCGQRSARSRRSPLLRGRFRGSEAFQGRNRLCDALLFLF